MKARFTVCFILLCMMLGIADAEAKIFSLGTIKSGGTFDKDPDHIILFFEGERKTLESTNAGTDWTIIKEEDIPKNLCPLQQKGIFPEYHVAGNTLIRISSDGKWQDISPWLFLNKMHRDDISHLRDIYEKEFGSRIPCHYESWYISFISAFAALAITLSAFLFKARIKWLLPLSQSLMLGAIFTFAIFILYYERSNFLLSRQWGSNLDTVFPTWSLGIAFQFLGNMYIAPLTAILLFPLTPLFCESRKLLKTPKSIWAYRIAALLPYCFIIYAVYSFLFGRSIDWYPEFQPRL